MIGKPSPYRPFPDPRKGGTLVAPIGAGVYELRHRSGDKELVLVGISSRVAHRMSSLLPKPYGTGTRNNEAKRRYVLRHIRDLEYRTIATKTRAQAAEIEREKLRANEYRFGT